MGLFAFLERSEEICKPIHRYIDCVLHGLQCTCVWVCINEQKWFHWDASTFLSVCVGSGFLLVRFCFAVLCFECAVFLFGWLCISNCRKRVVRNISELICDHAVSYAIMFHQANDYQQLASRFQLWSVQICKKNLLKNLRAWRKRRETRFEERVRGQRLKMSVLLLFKYGIIELIFKLSNINSIEILKWKRESKLYRVICCVRCDMLLLLLSISISNGDGTLNELM